MTHFQHVQRFFACALIGFLWYLTLRSAAESLFGELKPLALFDNDVIGTGFGYLAASLGDRAPSTRQAAGHCLLILSGCTFAGLFTSLLAIGILVIKGWQGAEPPITLGSATYLNYGGGDFVAHGSSALWQLLFGTAFLVIGGLWSRDRAM
ncbi:hypothetical protein [Phaeovulum sp. W22_SRMD_FR3]|uniref:hypothetical protein n=1 Tax=Phaeovulum sp. W22_SRMD_FR3 TaxID=3240274 RepID=UPI003F9EACB0